MNVLVFFWPKFCVSPNSRKFDVSCEKPNICLEGNSRLVPTGKQTVQKRRKSFDDYFIFGDAAYFDMTLYCSCWKAELLHSSTVSEGKVLRPLDCNECCKRNLIGKRKINNWCYFTLVDKVVCYRLSVVELALSSIDTVTVEQLSYQLMLHTDTPFSRCLLGNTNFVKASVFFAT